jgi:predicted flavoprotein YhiN
MVTVGGIETAAISPKTMASKTIDGLYIIGELMDVDGDTGGYNLQWAFSSAHAAVQAILLTI